jgi:hypothetical protein
MAEACQLHAVVRRRLARSIREPIGISRERPAIASREQGRQETGQIDRGAEAAEVFPGHPATMVENSDCRKPVTVEGL